jgi:hypothetical protein
MNKMTKVAAAVALAGVTASASAWWGGPFSGWGDDFFGDGWFNFSFSAHGSGRGWGRYYDYYGPWGGPYGYPYAAAYAPVHTYPQVLTEEQQAALQEQQKAAAEQHAQMLQKAVEAQREVAEQVARQQAELVERMQSTGYDPMSVDPFAGLAPYGADPAAQHDALLPPDVKALIERSDAEYAKVKADAQARREAYQKRAEERRQAIQERARDWRFSAEQGSI